MFRNLMIAGCLSAMLVGFVGEAKAAFYSENAIRQAGDNRKVTLSVSRGGQFSVQGNLGDVVFVRLSNGHVFAASTIYDLIFSPFCTDFYQSSNGEFVLRLFFYPQTSFDGGTVSIYRGATEVDTDRVLVVP